MLPGKEQGRFALGEALFWSVSWGLGCGLGVALGAWLTAVGGAGAPGTAGLQPISDLVVLPGVVFVAVTALQLAVRAGVAALRRPVESAERKDEE